MKISFFASFLLLSLCQLCSSSIFDSNRINVRGVDDNKFEQEHIVANLCTQVMIDRGFDVLNKTTCKPEKTFIKATVDEVRAVCGGGGKGVSKENFKLVECKVDPAHNKPPNCQYTVEEVEKKILVTCVKNKPTEFKIHE
ncbi:ribonuclease pancreatic-like [Sander lucioperca]|uniref:ribonuclease pancreatic-like n=1 Tax=Sander lucioperca TaxID=283035 RepID=UPI00125D9915|nr:ribonuclease pancreatic-like [Sander lucioperca]XP_035862504.1 ribonuclease pancreatic-like [Sander lucioperca]